MLIFRTNVFLTLKFLYIRIQLLLFLVVYDVICKETRCTSNKQKKTNSLLNIIILIGKPKKKLKSYSLLIGTNSKIDYFVPIQYTIPSLRNEECL